MPTPEELAAQKAAEEAAKKSEADKAAADEKAKKEKEAKENDPAYLRAELERERKERAAIEEESKKLRGTEAEREAAKKKEEEAARKAADDKLRAEGNFQALYENAEKRAKEEREGRDRDRRALLSSMKISQVQLKAREAGILDNAIGDLELIDLKEVKATQNENGTISFEGIDAAIAKLKTDKPHWFGKATAPKVNTGGGGNSQGGGNNTGRPTPEALLKLQEEGKIEEYQAGMKLWMQS